MTTLNSSFVQCQALSLAGSGCASTDTSITFSSFAQPNGTLITMSNFGSIGYIVLEPGTNNEESISFTGITQNTGGTATITGVTRGLAFVSPYVNVPANQLPHAGGTVAVVTNSAAFYGNIDSNENDENPTGLWTFSQLPALAATVTPTNPLQFATKAYADSVAGGVATTGQIQVAGTSGASLTQGQVVYLKNDGKWYVADSSASASSVAVQLGIVQNTVSSGAAITVITEGLDQTQTGLTAGSSYYLSTSGTLSTSQGTYVRFIGVVPYNSTTSIIINPTGGNPELLLRDGTRTFIADGGSANAYTMTLVPAINAYRAGQTFSFTAANSNTGASTLAVSGLTATNIYKNGSTPLTAGDIIAGQVVQVEYDGTYFQMVSAPSSSLSPTGIISPYAGFSAPSGWLLCNGAAVSRTTYATLFGLLNPTLGTVTITIATPGVVSLASHGLQTGDAIYLTTTGALPSGLSVNTQYWVIYDNSGAFWLASSLANALAATKISTTGTQSGTHTAHRCPYGVGDGSTTFNVPNLSGTVPVGLNTSDTNFAGVGQTGGEETHTLTIAEMPAHTHPGNYQSGSGGSTSGVQTTSTSNAQTASAVITQGGGSAHNNLQPYTALNYIIKT